MHTWKAIRDSHPKKRARWRGKRARAEAFKEGQKKGTKRVDRWKGRWYINWASSREDAGGLSGGQVKRKIHERKCRFILTRDAGYGILRIRHRGRNALSESEEHQVFGVKTKDAESAGAARSVPCKLNNVSVKRTKKRALKLVGGVVSDRPANYKK